MDRSKIIPFLRAELKKPRAVAALTLLAVWAGLPPGAADLIVQAVVAAIGV